MKLSDVMGAANLTIFAEAALLLFFAVFVAVVVRSVWHKDSAAWSRLGRLPLDDDQPSAGDAEGSSK